MTLRHVDVKMRGLVLLFFIVSARAAFSQKIYDNLEKLYESSDPSLPWPPVGKDFPEVRYTI